MGPGSNEGGSPGSAPRHWRSAARQSVDVVGCERTDAKETLLAAQVTTRSPMGAIALHCGAIVVAGGWLRILGSGNAKVGGGLREWNSTLGGQELDPPLGNTLVVAYDAVGGFFVLNGAAGRNNSGESTTSRQTGRDGKRWALATLASSSGRWRGILIASTPGSGGRAGNRTYRN